MTKKDFETALDRSVEAMLDGGHSKRYRGG